jgi:opacity protein-like surface antigen
MRRGHRRSCRAGLGASLPMLFLLLMALPRTAAAQETASPEPPPHHAVHRYMGGRVGYLRVDNVDPGSLNVGLSFGLSIRTLLALEASIDYHTGNYGADHRRTDALQASACLYPLPFLKEVRPYGVAGFGLYESAYEPVDEFDSTASNSKSSGGLHLGAGLEFWFRRKSEPKADWRAVLDFRYLYSRVGPDGRRRPEGEMITLGVKVRI